LLKQRESDLAEVQSVLSKAETESRRAGESATSDRLSLNLELDRARRDLARLEEELARVKKDLEDRENRWREREGTLDKLYAENRDLAAQLAAQTQARLNVSEKLDLVQAHLKTAEGEVVALKAKVNEVETRLSKDQRNLLSSEQQYRDQLTERNTLLLTIYQYMDKILGVDKTAVRDIVDLIPILFTDNLQKGEAKPFTNFTVFHDNLISRLKALSQIQLEFDKRCKEAENKFQDKLALVDWFSRLF
jgi:chromosome segregation ATPase